MTNADIILDYAYGHNETIVHKELVRWFSEKYPNESVRSMDTALQRLLASGILLRTGYGEFKLGKDVRLSARLLPWSWNIVVLTGTTFRLCWMIYTGLLNWFAREFTQKTRVLSSKSFWEECAVSGT